MATSCDSDSTFVVGETFLSYADLEKKVKAYEEKNFVQLVNRDSRTLDSAKQRVPKRVEGANQDLRYYSMNLACVFGGKDYKNRSKGLRCNQT